MSRKKKNLRIRSIVRLTHPYVVRRHDHPAEDIAPVASTSAQADERDTRRQRSAYEALIPQLPSLFRSFLSRAKEPRQGPSRENDGRVSATVRFADPPRDVEPTRDATMSPQYEGPFFEFNAILSPEQPDDAPPDKADTVIDEDPLFALLGPMRIDPPDIRAFNIDIVDDVDSILICERWLEQFHVCYIFWLNVKPAIVPCENTKLTRYLTRRHLFHSNKTLLPPVVRAERVSPEYPWHECQIGSVDDRDLYFLFQTDPES